MKYANQLIVFLVAIIFFISCKKDGVEYSPLASLNVINAVISGGNVKLNTNIRDSAKAYNSKTFGILPGADINLYPTNSPSTPYYSILKAQTENGGLYSVFLTGQVSNVESIFIKENVPAPYKDSIFGVRILNLSPNSTPVNITLQNNTAVNVFSNVAYRQLTDVITFPLHTIIPSGSVSFQVRSGVSPGTVLATYTLPASVNSLYPGISVALQRFKNITIVIKGLQGTTSGSNAFGVFPVVMSY